jgi:hypothetical protein
MTGQQIVIAAIEEAQRILAEYVEPGSAPRFPDVSINRLLSVLEARCRFGAKPPNSRRS